MNVTNPPETKIVAGGGAIVGVGIIVQLIENYFPHLKLPTPGELIYIAGTIATVIAYFAPHTARLEELLETIEQVAGEEGTPPPAPTSINLTASSTGVNEPALVEQHPVWPSGQPDPQPQGPAHSAP
jgi:hypothetical protein